MKVPAPDFGGLLTRLKCDVCGGPVLINWKSRDRSARGPQSNQGLQSDQAATQSPYPLQYYFARQSTEGTSLYPGLGEDRMGQPYFVIRQGGTLSPRTRLTHQTVANGTVRAVMMTQAATRMVAGPAAAA